MIHGVNLDRADLSAANLCNAKVTGSFVYAVLLDADLTGAGLWSSVFDETRLGGVFAEGADFGPFVPIIQRGEKEFSMFKGLQSKFHCLLPLVKYRSARGSDAKSR